MAFDRLFGFDLIQRKTLEKLLEEMEASNAELVAAVEDLEGRVAVLEAAAA